MGGKAIACINARDRNQLGFRRDLLTADAYGVTDFLFVYGDRPESGARSDDLTVQLMLDLARRFRTRIGRWPVASVSPPVRGRCRPGSATPTSCACRSPTHSTRCSPGATVCASTDPSMPACSCWPARRWPGSCLRTSLSSLSTERSSTSSSDNPGAGVDMACELIEAIRQSGAFDGVHVIPVGRYREVAARLERL